MRLIVHMGFHKTASTHLQGLMNRNSDRLAECGIWYEHQPGYPAHHGVAHALMKGDSAPLEAMVANALTAGCHTMILSSEDLECALFNPAVPDLIEQVAAGYGIGAIEWHAAIREPGAYFESLYPQLSWHSFASALHMFSEVMKKGVLFMPEPFLGEGATPYWFYCFDYELFLTNFAASGRDVFLHDYADRKPFPGWRMLERLDALGAIVEPVEDDHANRRLAPAIAGSQFADRLHELVEKEASWDLIDAVVDDHIKADQAMLPRLAHIISDRFGESYRGAIEKYERHEPDVRIAA